MSPRQHEIAREWLRRAKSNLIRSKLSKPDQVYWEDLCFDAQQAAEKALKALFILHAKKFPFTHDIGELISELEAFIADIPAPIREAAILTDYAVATRYPGWGKPVTVEEYRDALKRSEAVVEWVNKLIDTH
ncbi:MAG: HEPN domain-containing protein [Deltaproteobacteria bacterium]|nr:HEPN domain-containing protein [Deltaproteobacteria bacterium]